VTHLASILFAFAGFAALCLAMVKHQQDVLGRRLAASRQTPLRLTGGVLLAVAYGCASLANGPRVGPVAWTGALIVAALALTLLLPLRPRWMVRAASGAAATGALLLIASAVT